MRSAFRQRAIPYSTHPRPYRRLLLSALGIPHPVPRTLAARSIPTLAYTTAPRMATQPDMPGVPASAPEHEAPVDVPAGEASSAAAVSAAEQAEAKPVAKSTDDGVDDAATAAAEPALPPLTPAEFREFNRLADQMAFYHNHFKQSWNILHDAASTGRRPKNMTLKQFLDTGLSFVRGLAMHHDIEETYLYPMLAPKMPEFRHAQGGGGGGSKKPSQKQSELIQQHRDIHDGMEQFEDYISKCRSREADLEMGVLLEKLDSWSAVLWKHMDQEVQTLGAANMRKYYTVNEMRRLRM